MTETGVVLIYRHMSNIVDTKNEIGLGVEYD